MSAICNANIIKTRFTVGRRTFVVKSATRKIRSIHSTQAIAIYQYTQECKTNEKTYIALLWTQLCQPPGTPNSQNIDLRQNNVYIETIICLIVYRVINSDVILGYEILLHTRVSTIKRFLIRWTGLRRVWRYHRGNQHRRRTDSKMVKKKKNKRTNKHLQITA